MTERVDRNEANEILLGITTLKKELDNVKIQNEALRGKLEAREAELKTFKSTQAKCKRELQSLLHSIGNVKKPHSGIRCIQEKVCDYFKVGYRELVGSYRGQNIVKARHIAMYLCRQAGFSYTDIGNAFHKDHTTVISGVDKVRYQEELKLMAEEIGK